MVFILACLGLMLGSFVNALVWRLHKQEEVHEQATAKRTTKKREGLENYSIVTGRSMCSACHHPLAPADLIPVVSWLMLRGKCRYCHKWIEDTPLPELSLAALIVVSYIWWPLGWGASGITYFCFWIVFLTAFVALAVYDLRWMLLPDRIVFPLIGLAAARLAVNIVVFHGGLDALAAAAWGVGILAGLFYALFELSRGRWIGFGDVKLAIVLGLLAGGPWAAVLLMFVASLLGSVVAIPLLIRGKARGSTKLPFGPFLLAATIVVVLFGQGMIVWYQQLLYLR